MNFPRQNRGFATLLGLLLAIIIIVFLGLRTYTYYLNRPSLEKDSKIKKTLSTQGFDTSSQQGILDSTKEKIKDVEKMMIEREEEIFGHLKEQSH